MKTIAEHIATNPTQLFVANDGTGQEHKFCPESFRFEGEKLLQEVGNWEVTNEDAGKPGGE